MVRRRKVRLGGYFSASGNEQQPEQGTGRQLPGPIYYEQLE